MEEKKKSKISNYSLIGLTIIGIIAFLGVNAYLRIKDEYEEKLTYALKTKIEYYAKRCYLEDKCTRSITVKELYEKKYITTDLVDPITNEVIDPNTQIYINNNKATVEWGK